MTMDEEEEFMPDIQDLRDMLVKHNVHVIAPEPVSTDIVQRAMVEASELSGLPMCDLPPVEVLPKWMMEEAIGKAGVLGAYHWEAHEVILEGPWSPDVPDNWVTLIHELTHAMQGRALGPRFLNSYAAIKATELQAYAVEEAWFRKHGLTNPRFEHPFGRATLEWQTGVPWTTDRDVERAVSYANQLPRV